MKSILVTGLVLVLSGLSVACSTTRKGSYDVKDNSVSWQAQQKGYQKFNTRIEVKNALQQEEMKKLALLHTIAFCKSTEDGLVEMKKVNALPAADGTTKTAEIEFKCQTATKADLENQSKLVDPVAGEKTSATLEDLTNRVKSNQIKF